MTDSAPNLQGRLLGGRYRVEQLLGEGGMGAVYAAVQEDLHRRVAIKVLHGELSPEDILRFRHEALAAAALGHPNIVQVTDFQTPPGEPPFLVMEALEGISLRGIIERSGKLPAQRTVFIAVQILAALAVAHRAQIIHRDIKPANVFLSRTPAADDFVKLLDFGIAKVLRDGAQSPQTATGAILGTPAYMAPEQALGTFVDHRVDLYAVGAVMYEMIAGRRPLVGATSGELLVAIARQVPPKLVALVPDVDERLSDLVDRALSKDPERRPKSAHEMIEALSPWARSAVSRAQSRPTDRTNLDASATQAQTRGPDPHASTTALGHEGGGATLWDGTQPLSPPYVSAPPPPHPSSPTALGAGPVLGPHPHYSGYPQPALSSAPRTGPVRPRSLWPWFIGVALLVVVAVASAIVLVVLDARGRPPLVGGGPGAPVIPAPNAGPGVLFDSAIGIQGDSLPVPASLVGDATEDVLVEVETLAFPRRHAVALYDGATLRQAWITPPFDREGTTATKALVHASVGGRAVFVSGVRTLHVLDGATGRELSTAEAPAAPIHLCVADDSTREVWIELEDARGSADPLRGGVLLDVISGALRPASGPPRGCGFLAIGRPPPRLCASTALCTEAAAGKRTPRGAMSDGIAVGIEDNPSTHEDRLFGIDLSTRTQLWQRTLPASGSFMGPTRIVEVARRRLYVQHLEKLGAFHLDCIDLSRGTLLWTFSPGVRGYRSADAVRVGARRVYVTRNDRVEILDADTGTLVGVLGML